MIKSILVLSLFVSSSAFASFLAECDYDAEVVKVTELSTLNTPVVGNFRTGEDNYTRLMDLKLSNGVVRPGSHIQSCKETLVQTIMEKDNEYKVGQKLKISIYQANSRNGFFKYSISTKNE